MNSDYVGVLPPELLEDDPWFGPAPDTELSVLRKKQKQKEKKESYLKAVEDNQLLSENNTTSQVKELENIHQKMYEIATKNVATTLSLDPLPSLGGSENFQESWMSGVGPHFK